MYNSPIPIYVIYTPRCVFGKRHLQWIVSCPETLGNYPIEELNPDGYPLIEGPVRFKATTLGAIRLRVSYNQPVISPHHFLCKRTELRNT